MWMKKIDHVTYFHDTRLLHDGMQSKKYAIDHLCQTFIGVHQVYPKIAFEMWKKVKSQKKFVYDVPDIQSFDMLCKYSKVFDWRSMAEGYRFKPDRCSNKPVWKDMKMWGGEGGTAEVPWYKRRMIRN